MHAVNPIGIFDSGVGGLTIARELANQLPKEKFIYFGDTAHLPYGDKSPELIQKYASDITQFLLQYKVKAILIACNSASAVANDAVLKASKNKLPIFNVIDPVVDYIANSGIERVGIIGTKATINSGVYSERLAEKAPGSIIKLLSTPLLAPLVEEGFYNSEISKLVIKKYLDNPKLKDIQAIVLACTHYPLLKNDIQEYYGGKVEVIDPSVIVSNYLTEMLKEIGMISNYGNFQFDCFVSDYTEGFANSAKMFFGDNVKLEIANQF